MTMQGMSCEGASPSFKVTRQPHPRSSCSDRPPTCCPLSAAQLATLFFALPLFSSVCKPNTMYNLASFVNLQAALEQESVEWGV